MNNIYKYSIVTVVYNSLDISKTIKSVNNQTYEHIEHIIIDGKSDDGTLDVINQFSTKLQKVYSEKDNGIYDAMNKGIKFCSGDFVIMLNAGDVFYSINSIERINSMINNPDLVYYTRAAICSSSDKLLYIKPGETSSTFNRIKYFPIHQSVIVPRIYFTLKYDVNYKICSDTLYLIQLFKISKPVFLDVVSVKFYMGGISNAYKTIKELKLILKETLYLVKVYEKNIFTNSIKVYIKFTFKYLLNKTNLSSFIFKIKNL